MTCRGWVPVTVGPELPVCGGLHMRQDQIPECGLVLYRRLVHGNRLCAGGAVYSPVGTDTPYAGKRYWLRGVNSKYICYQISARQYLVFGYSQLVNDST
ncbi:hypothetical protein EB796_017083 [Bugula neritina]|uniref:Uncharacterized protein n=1 Tax=Bugula neritina TaxID=10212 RepID=A0A7J7JEB6_BUGNE|nr:hypothetical protein EB796_017083 [Bugula neritina]